MAKVPVYYEHVVGMARVNWKTGVMTGVKQNTLQFFSHNVKKKKDTSSTPEAVSGGTGVRASTWTAYL